MNDTQLISLAQCILNAISGWPNHSGKVYPTILTQHIKIYPFTIFDFSVIFILGSRMAAENQSIGVKNNIKFNRDAYIYATELSDEHKQTLLKLPGNLIISGIHHTGPVAQFLSTTLRSRDISRKIECILFGSSRIGDHMYEAYYRKQNIPVYHIFINGDPNPDIPDVLEKQIPRLIIPDYQGHTWDEHAKQHPTNTYQMDYYKAQITRFLTKNVY